MTNESLETTLILFFLFYTIASFGASVWLSVKKNEVFLANNPKLIPYKWGYFWGYVSILVAPVFIFYMWFDIELGTYNFSLSPGFDKILVSVLYSFSIAVIGFGIIKRIPLAWIALVVMFLISFVFQLNWIGLGLAAINGYYAWNRRQELAFISFLKKK